MIDVKSAVEGIVSRLTAGGVPATDDLRDLNPPGALVPPPVIEWRFGKGAVLTWRVILVAANIGQGPALDVLSELIDKAWAALDGVTDGRPVDLANLEGGAPLPGYALAFTSKAQPI